MDQIAEEMLKRIPPFRLPGRKAFLIPCLLLVILAWAPPSDASLSPHISDGCCSSQSANQLAPDFQNTPTLYLLARGGPGGGRGRGQGSGGGSGQCDGSGSGQGKGKGYAAKDGTGTPERPQDGTGYGAGSGNGTGDRPRDGSGKGSGQGPGGGNQ